jgi:hypothetical protein
LSSSCSEFVDLDDGGVSISIFQIGLGKVEHDEVTKLVESLLGIHEMKVK